MSFSLTSCSPKTESAPEAPVVEAQPETTAEVQPTEVTEEVQSTEVEAQQEIEIVVAQNDDVTTMDPQKPGGQYGGNLSFNLFDGLVKRSGDMSETFEGLAIEWKLLDDFTWEFKLREGVKFHNGEIVNAHAVKYTIDRMLMPDTVRTLYSFGTLDHAEVIDDYTVRIITKVPDPYLSATVFDLKILPPEYAEDVGEDAFGIAPIGAGPYKLIEYSPNQRIVLEAFENYWGEKPTVDRLIFKPVPEQSTRLAELLSGTSDIVLNLAPEDIALVESSPGVHVASTSGKRVAYVGMDLLPDVGPDFLKDKRVRQAFNYAIDKEAIIDSILGGYASQTATIYRPDFEGYDPDLQPYPYDPAKAKELLADAGYSEGDISLKITTSEGITTKAIELAEAVAAMLQEIGVNAEVNSVAYQQQRDMYIGGQEAHNVDALYVWNWGSRDSNASSPLNGMMRSTGITSFIRDPKLDDLILKATTTMDVNERIKYNEELQAYILDEAFCIYLWVVDDVYGVSDKIDWTPRRDQYVLGSEIKVVE